MNGVLVRKVLSRIGWAGVLLAFAAFFGVPVLWMILAPTKTPSELYAGFPLAFGSFERVPQAWANLLTYNDGIIVSWIYNSFYYAGWSVALAVLVCVPAGYALAVHTFVGRKAILIFSLIAMMVPNEATVLPLYLEMNELNLLGTPPSVILPLAFYPFGIYLVYLHYSTNLPESILEAARVDGASDLAVFWRIGIPLGIPVIAFVAFFNFFHGWSNYFLPFVMLDNSNTYNLQVGLTALLQATGATGSGGLSTLPINEPEAALAGLIAVAPVLLSFIVFQRFLISGQSMGAEKG